MATELARRAGKALIWRGFATGVEKVIFLARLLILARLLAPEDFGLVAIGMTVLAVTRSLTDFGVVASLIQQPAANKRHLDTAWTINLARGLLIVFALIVLAPWLAGLFSDPRATDIIRALALTALLDAMGSIDVARLNRELRFGGLAGIRVGGALANTIVAIAMASDYGAWALVWGAVAGASTQMLLSYVAAPYRPAIALVDKATLSIARFGRWMFLIGILAVATDALLRWLVATRLGVAELGLFFMAVRLAFLPAQLVSELVGEVAFPVYAQLQTDKPKAEAAFRGLQISVAALLVPACLVFAWLVPELVEHVLGPRWEGMIAVTQLLILSSVAGLLGDAVGPLLKGSGEPAGIAAMDSLQLALIASLGWLLVPAFGLEGAGVAWVCGVVGSQFLAVLYARQLLERPFAGLGAPILAICVIALLTTAVSAIVATTVPGPYGLVLAILLAAATAAIVTVAVDRRFDLGILQTISGPFPWLRRFAGPGQP